MASNPRALCRGQFEVLNMDYFRNSMGPGKNACAARAPIRATFTRLSSSEALHGYRSVSDYSRVFNSKDACESINPDEAFAYGKAAQAAILTGVGSSQVQDLLLLDVTPPSMGLVTASGV